MGQDKNGNRFIETVPTKGYRFVAEVSEPVAIATGLFADGTKNPAAITPGAELPKDIALSDTAKPKRTTRKILFTAGFAGAVALIFLLSFNFRPASPARSNDVKPLLQKQYTTNDEAYRLYLLGAALTDKMTRGDAEKAIDAYEQAIKLDPNYAPAYAGMANVHTDLAFMGGKGNATEQYLKAKTAIEKALAIDDNLAEAHAYLGEMKTNFEWDFVAAERRT